MKQLLFSAPTPSVIGLTIPRLALVFSLFFFALLPGTGLGQTAVDSAGVVKEVDSLIQVSRGLTDQRDFDKALELNEVAEKLTLEKLGQETAAFGNVCYNHGRVLFRKKEYAEAEKWWLKALDLRERTVGKEHLDYAMSLNELGLLYGKMDYNAKAERFLLDAKSIREKKLGKEHPDYARSLNTLGNLYFTMGNYEQAEQLSIEAKSIWEKTEGKEQSGYAASLNSLSNIYSEMGAYENAVQILIEAKTIWKKILGTSHRHYVASVNNLARLYQFMGDYEQAELLYLEAKMIWEKISGVNDPDYAYSLNNLATLYSIMGNYAKAESLFLEAKIIREKKLGKWNSEYGSSVLNLAIFYQRIEEYERSEPLNLEAIEIFERLVGKEHPDYATCLNNLANNYNDMGMYSKSEQLHLEAMAIREKAFGKEHPIYSSSLNNLANLYKNIGDYKKSEAFYREAKAIREKTLGKEHPEYVLSIDNLANFYFSTFRYSEAALLYDTASSIQQILLSKGLTHLSERELHGYFRKLAKNQARILALTRYYPPTTPTAYNNTLFYKGFLLSAYNQVKRLALTDSASTGQFNLLKSYERRLAAEYAKPMVNRDSAKVAELEEKANNLEKVLTRSVAGYGESVQPANWQEVQQNLKPGETAIEFVHYRIYLDANTDSTMYAALILRPGWPRPFMVNLFEQRDIQPLLAAANTAATAGQLYASRGSKRGENSTRGGIGQGIVIPGPKTASLYQLIWAPMDSLLHGTTRVYYAPSGLIHRLNIDAIAVPGADQTLADRYALVQLGSTRSLAIGTKARQLVVQDGSTTSTAKTAALFGGLRYEAITPAAEVSDSAQQTHPAFDIAALRSALGGPGGDAWNYLPGTDKEVKNAAKTLEKAGYSVSAFSGSDGTEAAFKMLGSGNNPAPAVLHIATHGFFFPDPKDTTQANSPSIGGGGGELVFKTSDNPLLRSGLVLAGANPAWSRDLGSKTSPDEEDGILTAYEISLMNLGGTELVVLSACETGLGDVEDNEGVYGLKRAFKIAGVKYLVMSLWQVPDQQTQELMSAFYKNWLERKMAIPAAFAAAQRAIRERYGAPFFWAGFVLVE